MVNIKYKTEQERKEARKKDWKKWYEKYRTLSKDDEILRNSFMRELYSKGISVLRLAQIFRMSRTNAHNIIKGFYK